jgi:hypothetical protein
MDSGDKSHGKAMSYAYKSMAFAAFAIPTEGDNDPDAKTHEVVAKQPVADRFTPPKTETAPTPGVDAAYQTRVRNALRTIYGEDKVAGLNKVEELTTFIGKDGDKVAGRRDFQKLTGKSLQILAHELEKLAVKSITE